MPKLIAPLAYFAVGVEDAVHGPDGAEVFCLLEQSRPDLRRSQIYESFAAQLIEHGLALLVAECAWLAFSFLRHRYALESLALPVHGRTRNIEGTTRRCRSNLR